MTRRKSLIALALGFIAGLAIGPLSLLMVAASDAWVRGWPWPKFDSKYFLLLLATSLPAGLNGAIGAGLAAGWGRKQRFDIFVLPVALHILAAVPGLLHSNEFLLFQLMALLFSVVVWPAGRLGQVIGAAIRGRQLETSPFQIGSLSPTDANHVAGASPPAGE